MQPRNIRSILANTRPRYEGIPIHRTHDFVRCSFIDVLQNLNREHPCKHNKGDKTSIHVPSQRERETKQQSEARRKTSFESNDYDICDLSYRFTLVLRLCRLKVRQHQTAKQIGPHACPCYRIDACIGSWSN